MRILVANWCERIIGGVETYLRDLLPALRNRGHDIRIIVEVASRTKEPTICLDKDIKVYDLANGRSVCREASSWADVCYLHGFADPIHQSWLIDEIPTVLFAHNYHGTCISGSKTYSFPIIRQCSQSFGIACLTRYYPCRCGGLNPKVMLRLYREQVVRNKLLHKYAAIAVASHHMVREYVRNKVNPEKVCLLPLFPTSREQLGNQIENRTMTNKVLFIGRLTKLKGADIAVKATEIASRLLGRSLTLSVLGDGPELSRLQQLVLSINANVEFHGWVNSETRNREIMQSALLLIPSIWPEPFGLVGIESGRLGIPAVGYAVGGISDWLISGVTGEIAEFPCNEQTLAAAIVRALRSYSHWHSLSTGACIVSSRFSLDCHLDLLIPLLSSNSRTHLN